MKRVVPSPSSLSCSLCSSLLGNTTKEFIQTSNLRHSNASFTNRFGKSSRDEFNAVGQFIYGVQPVALALKSMRRSPMNSLFVVSKSSHATDIRDRIDADSDTAQQLQWIVRTAKSHGVPINWVSKHDLNVMSGDRPHQGVILDATPLSIPLLSDLAEQPETSKHLWVLLDGVTDPQNLGAIIRSCFFFNACGVVMSSRNTAPLSAVTSKASAGAVEVMSMAYCDSTHDFLEVSKSNGWHIYGTQVNKDTKSISSDQVVLHKPSILVLGSEGDGVRKSVLRVCDEVVTIQSSSPTHTRWLDSLNVSVAAGVLLHDFMRSRRTTESVKTLTNENS